MNEQEMKAVSGKTKLAILALILLLLAAVFIWGYNLFRLEEITYSGLTRYTQEEMTTKLKTSFGDRFTPFFCMQDSEGDTGIPFIEKYKIEYTGRHSAHVIVYEKRVIGCLPLMGRYMYFDKDGVIVESSPEQLQGIPVVEGLEFTEITLYQKLKIQKQSLFKTILELTRLIEDNKLSVQVIRFESNYEVILETGDITVLLGKRETYDEPLEALYGILEKSIGKSGTLDMKNYTKENQEVILK